MYLLLILKQRQSNPSCFLYYSTLYAPATCQIKPYVKMPTMTGFKKVLVAGGILLSVVAILALTIYGAVYTAERESNKGTPANTSCQGGKHMVHNVVIQNNKVSPSSTVAPLCDTLTITNLDDKERLIAFGLHEHHVAYDGITERILTQSQSFTVTLIQKGNFRFHDHWHDKIQGTFTVTKEN